MNRTVFSLPAHSEYRTRGGLEVSRSVEHFTGGASRLDDLIELLDRRRGVVLSSGTTVPGRYESFDLGFSDPPLRLETAGSDFSLQALNARGEVLIAFLGEALREPCVVISEKNATRSGRAYRAGCSTGRRRPAPPARQRDVAGPRPRGGARRQ
jgi:anthranilate synthase